jgi:hypothetical protein
VTAAVRFAAMLLLWMSAGALCEVARLRPVTAWIDLPEIVSGGAPACAAALVWGTRCRREPGGELDRQHAADGCGPAVLYAVLGHTPPAPPQDLLWSICRRPGGGTTLGSLARTAHCFGRRSRVVWDPRLERIAVPAIVHLRRGHFILLERRGRGCAWLLDPALGRVRVPWPALRAAASGATLEFPASNRPPRAACDPGNEEAS